MSLLNDALRKKRTEQQPPPQCEAATLFRGRRARRFQKGYWAAGIASAAVLLLVAGAWAWRPWSNIDAGSSLMVDEASGQTEALPLPEPTAQLSVAAVAQNAPGSTPSPAETAAPAAPMAAAAEPPRIQAPTATPASIRRQVSVLTEHPTEPAIAPPTPQRSSTNSGHDPQPASTPTRPISSEPLYQKARLYQRQGRMTEAMGMYREVLKIDPDHFEASLNLTSVYLQTEAFSQAYVLSADLYRRAPANPRVVLNLAAAQIGCGRAQEALPLLDQAAAQPQAPLYEIYFHKGVAHRQLGQTEAAIAWYQKAEQLNPGDGRLLFNLAVAFDQQQAYEPAVVYYLKYLRAAGDLDPAGRRKIEQRVRALRADLAVSASGEAAK